MDPRATGDPPGLPGGMTGHLVIGSATLGLARAPGCDGVQGGRCTRPCVRGAALLVAQARVRAQAAPRMLADWANARPRVARLATPTISVSLRFLTSPVGHRMFGGWSRRSRVRQRRSRADFQKFTFS